MTGEVRRSYKKEPETLKKVISWYEVFFQIGLNIGAGLPVVFTGLQFRIGFLKLDKLNMVNVLIALCSFVLVFVSYYNVTDLSKVLMDLEATGKIPIAAGEDQFALKASEKHADNDFMTPKVTNSPSKSSQPDDQPTGMNPSTNLMTFWHVFQFDIITLCLAYGIVR